MILPIYALGQPVLKKVAQPITPDYPDLYQLIADMWETMYHADGIGIAAPQIGRSVRIFVADTTLLTKQKETASGFKRVFLNPEKLEETGVMGGYEEGCLSIPHIRGEVDRLDTIRLRWQDEHFEFHEEVFGGMNARVIQHEYDHLQGILFTELLKPLKRRLIQRKLDEIRAGKVQADYKMRYYLPQ